MEIVIAKNSGLCYGVKRALNIARKTRRQNEGRVSTLGALIHNPQVISDLEDQGIDSVEDIGAIATRTVIIRSHGVSPEVYNRLLSRRLRVVDATCPIVKRIQRLVVALIRKNRDIIIVGNREHPEIEGLIGYSRGRALIIENEGQVKALPQRKRRAVLAQSTQDLFLFERVVAALIEKTDELAVYNTICHSTQTRQKSTSALASEVDTLFIVGGKNSSNTNTLYQISRRILPKTYFIENADQIRPGMLRGARKIGISGGASTPPEAIDQAVIRIQESIKPIARRESAIQCQR